MDIGYSHNGSLLWFLVVQPVQGVKTTLDQTKCYASRQTFVSSTLEGFTIVEITKRLEIVQNRFC